jgi:hypothetical protein
MPLGAGRHRALAEELAEWWEDLAERGIGSQVVLAAVPPGWGRSAVLRQFAAGCSFRHKQLTRLNSSRTAAAAQLLHRGPANQQLGQPVGGVLVAKIGPVA